MTSWPPQSQLGERSSRCSRNFDGRAQVTGLTRPRTASAAIALAGVAFLAGAVRAEFPLREQAPILLPRHTPADSLETPLATDVQAVDTLTRLPQLGYRLSASSGTSAHGDLALVAMVPESSPQGAADPDDRTGEANASDAPFLIGPFDLELRIGGEILSLRPRDALEYEGLHPVLSAAELETSSASQLLPALRALPSEGGPLTLAAGGQVVEVSTFPDGELVTFRILDLELDVAFEAAIGGPLDSTPAAEDTGSASFPARISANGAVLEQLLTYRVDHDLACPGPFDSPGVVLQGGTSVLLPSLPPSGPTLPTHPGNGGDLGGATITIVRSEAEPPTLAPTPGSPPGSASTEATPPPGTDDDLVDQLIAEIGLSGDDYRIDFDAESGSATIAGSGDLLLRGGTITIEGLRELVIRAEGRIEIAGSLILPVESALVLDAFLGVEVDDGTSIVIPPRTTAICDGLAFVEASEPETLAVVEFEALPVRTIGIDVRPGRAINRVKPFSRGLLPVAILGSESLDVRELEPSMLRLGPQGAAPNTSRLGRPFDTNDDGHDDIIVRFPIAGSGLAIGDTELCLHGWTSRGEIEGCDAVDTHRSERREFRPGRPRWVF